MGLWARAPFEPAANHLGQITGSRSAAASRGLGRCCVIMLSTLRSKGSHAEKSSRIAADPGERPSMPMSFQAGIDACTFFSTSVSMVLKAAL